MSQAGTSDDQLTGEERAAISVGQELRRAREVRGVSLAQLADETRIALRHLEALEADRFGDLPGQLYARNFVKQVARSLGADEQELLDYFDYQSGESSRAAAAGEVAEAGQGSRRRLAFGALALALLIIAAVLGFALTRESGSEASSASDMDPAPPPVEAAAATPEPPRGQGAAGERVRPEPTAPKPDPSASAAVETPAEAEPEPAPSRPAPAAEPEPAAATPDPEPEPEPAATTPEAQREPEAATPVESPEPPALPQVKLTFSGPSWVEVVPEDGGQVLMGLKTRGDELAFALDSAVELTVMNAGNVELWLDGKPARALGVPGERRTIRLDSRTWQTYLR